MTAPSRTYGEARSAEETATDREILNKVLNGIELLKKKYGDDWVDKIDLETLQLSSGTRCVLGQVGRATYGGKGYGEMIDLLRRDFGELGDGYDHGFISAVYDDYPRFNKTWKREISRLKAERHGGN